MEFVRLADWVGVRKHASDGTPCSPAFTPVRSSRSRGPASQHGRNTRQRCANEWQARRKWFLFSRLERRVAGWHNFASDRVSCWVSSGTPAGFQVSSGCHRRFPRLPAHGARGRSRHGLAPTSPCLAMDDQQRAVAFLRGHVKKHFAGSVAPINLPGYYALVHTGWRLQCVHPRYPPEGCWWQRVFWAVDP